MDSQGVGKTPSIQSIIFNPTGGFAFAVGLSALGIEWINAHTSFQQLLDRRSPTGLDGKRNRAVGWSFSRNFFETKADCSISNSSITLPVCSTTDAVGLASQIQSAKAPVLLPLLGVIHGLVLLFIGFASLSPAVRRADIMAYADDFLILSRGTDPYLSETKLGLFSLAGSTANLPYAKHKQPYPKAGYGSPSPV